MRDGIVSNMKAVPLVRTRITYAASAFAELALWRVPKPVAGSRHRFKYRLVYVVDGVCVIRYDNESRKGDHRHVAGRESSYAFTTPDQLGAVRNNLSTFDYFVTAPYAVSRISPVKLFFDNGLIADFQRDIARWGRENRNP